WNGSWPPTRDARAESVAAGSASRLMLEKVPLFALVGASAVVTMLAQRTAGSVQTLALFPWTVRAANAVVSAAEYLRLTFWPKGMSCFYPLRANLDADYWGSLLGPTLVSAVVLVAISVLVVRLRDARPYLLVGWLWYLGTMVPVAGLVQVGSQAMADRYTYLPSIGLYLMIAFGAADAVGRARIPRFVWSAVAVTALTILAILSWRQTAFWKDTVTLMEHALAVTERNYLAHNNLGLALSDLGQTEAAAAQFRLAIAAKPNQAEAHCNLGLVEVDRGNLDAAAIEFEQAVRYDDQLGDAWNNLGRVHDLSGRTAEAIACYRRALATAEPPVVAARNLAWLLSTASDAGLRDGAEAVRWAETFARAVGERFDALLTAAAAHAQAGDFAVAVQLQQRALEVAPTAQRASVQQHLEQYRRAEAYR
ncbi:MAG: tetratricopeptide repeat protein, partial [Candidatus Eisenbacteria bacterium]|nr:tetratricopeptide repeat protein [Candidatus Eisenbacteria bacterium]